MRRVRVPHRNVEHANKLDSVLDAREEATAEMHRREGSRARLELENRITELREQQDRALRDAAARAREEAQRGLARSNSLLARKKGGEGESKRQDAMRWQSEKERKEGRHLAGPQHTWCTPAPCTFR